MGESAQATEWFLQLLGVVPTDAGILQRMGEMCDAEGDKSQAFQYHYDVSGIELLHVKCCKFLNCVGLNLRHTHIYRQTKIHLCMHYHFFFQSYRYNPSNISVIEWLGAYYIDSQFCEKAIQYFERASIIQ